MQKKNNLLDIIVIRDWSGNELYQGRFDSPRVDGVLEANRCTCKMDLPQCSKCDNTGYSGDFSVGWIIEQDRNVYECINY